MPLPKSLSCAQVKEAIDHFFGGVSVKKLSEHYLVTRLTITRLLRGETYKNCGAVENAQSKEYLDRVTTQMRENSRRGRGNVVEIAS